MNPEEFERKRARARVTTMAHHRRVRHSVPMAEYRARIHDEFLERQALRKVAIAARKEERRLDAANRRAASVIVRKERQAENGRKWREANRERNRELVRAWKARNPEKVSAGHKTRKVSSRLSVVRALWKGQRGRCAYCTAKLDRAAAHVDHIHPLSRGGADKRANLQLTCAPCNLSKGAKDPHDFARERGLLL